MHMHILYHTGVGELFFHLMTGVHRFQSPRLPKAVGGVSLVVVLRVSSVGMSVSHFE